MKRLQWWEYITQNVYWFAISMGSGSLTPLIMPILVEGLAPDPNLKNTLYGMLRAAGLAVAILVQPAAGLLSDRSTSRWGRRRPYIAVGGLLTALLVVGMIVARDYWALFGIALLVQFASNIAHGALQGVIPDVTPEDRRGLASAVKSVFDLAPTIVVAFTIARLISSDATMPAVSRVTPAILALGGIYIVAMLITILGVREVPLREAPAGSVSEPLLRTLGLLLGVAIGAAAAGVVAVAGGGLAYLITWIVAGQAQALLIAVGVGGLIVMLGTIVAGVWAAVHLGTGDARRHQSFTWWVVNRLAFMAAVGSLLAFALYFLQDALKVPDPKQTAANLQMAAGGCTLLAVIVSGYLADHLGRRRLVVVAGIVAAAGTALLVGAGSLAPALATLLAGLGTAVSVATSNIALVLGAGCLIGIGTGLFYTTSWALGTELTPPGEAGRFLGIQNVAGAGAGIVGGSLGGVLADYFNAVSAGSGYLVIFSMFGACFLLSSLVMLRVREPVAAVVETTP